MTYFVLDPSGTQYGPADMLMLQQWVREGRIEGGTTIRDAATGETMLASALPGLFQGTFPPNTQGAPVPGYAYVPRSAAGVNNNDVTIAWVLAGIGIFFAFGCPLIGVGLGIGGVIFARRALAAGDPRAQAPLYASYAAIGLSAIMLAVFIFGLIGAQSFGGGN
ncbi:MAG: hypothetical protein ACHQ50_02590 [Fimbriimonadales bacterium]